LWRVVSPKTIDAVLALNVRAPLLLAGATAARMARNGGGSIITISSTLSHLGNTRSSVYAASEGAVDAATRALAADWGASNVRVNTVRPAVTCSPPCRRHHRRPPSGARESCRVGLGDGNPSAPKAKLTPLRDAASGARA
jgi:NAD(P)-dependent dehydrogenase (short-subunit alcohol dehydrogenase family)